MGEVAERTGSGGTPSSSDPRYYGGSIPFLSIGDITGRFVDTTQKTLTEEGLANSTAWIVPQGAISLAMYASYGKSAILSRPMATSQAFFNVVFSSDATRDFIYSRFQCAEVRHEWDAMVSTGTQPNLSGGKLKKWEISLPPLPEQRLIGRFFKTLDSLIAAAERQEALLRQKKQAYLQLMFPREGKTQPRLRFSGFTGEWQQRQLGEVVSAAGVKNKERQHLQSYSISNQSGFIPQAEQFDNGGKPLDADKSSYWIVAPHSFAYNPARINVGSIGYWSGEEPVIVSSLYEVFQTHESVDDSFLLDWFRTRLFTNQIAKRQEGGVRQYFFFDKLQESQIHLPSLPEQHRIGQFFSTLDSLVSVAEGRTKALQVLKSAYLQRMFV